MGEIESSKICIVKGVQSLASSLFFSHFCGGFVGPRRRFGDFHLAPAFPEFPHWQIHKLFRSSALLSAPLAPQNSPSTFSNRRMRQMKPLRVYDGPPRPIQRVAAYSDLQTGAIYKSPRRQGGPSRSLPVAHISLQVSGLSGVHGAGRSLASSGSTLV